MKESPVRQHSILPKIGDHKLDIGLVLEKVEDKFEQQSMFVIIEFSRMELNSFLLDEHLLTHVILLWSFLSVSC